MNKTGIAWTDYSWNPVTGCTPTSEGCSRCYAQALAKRFGWEQGVALHPERLPQPKGQRNPARIFVCSMSDLFHEDVPDAFIRQVWEVMHDTERHTFQVLTKRPKRLREWTRVAASLMGWRYEEVWPRNVWLGVTAENQARADERIPLLLQVPAAVRFVSVEPMLGPVRLQGWEAWGEAGHGCQRSYLCNTAGAEIGWVIAGCESGPGARPSQTDWYRSLRDQCVEAGVAFFLKQMAVAGRIAHVPPLDGQAWQQYPEAR